MPSAISSIPFFWLQRIGKLSYWLLQPLLAASFLAFFSLGSGCTQESQFATLAPGERVLVLGDSISAAYGLDAKQSWVEELASRSSLKVINTGISGDTAAQAKARLPALLQQHQPGAVIIELGGNDMLAKREDQDIVTDLRTLIRQVKKSGAQPILMAVPRPSVFGQSLTGLSDAEFYEPLAREENIALIPNVIADVLSDADMRIDNLHPNIKGQKELGKAAFEVLRDLNIAG